MPYTKENLPENIQKLPDNKKSQWLEVFNSAYAKAIKDKLSEKEAETSAFKQANAVVLSPKLTDPQFYIQLSENTQDIKILYVGKFKHALFGDFEVTEKDLQNAVENFNNKIAVRLDESGNPELPANYQHASFEKNPETSKASGWIKSIYLKGKELFAKMDWTEKAKEFIKSKEFKYISPEFTKNWEDENGKKHGFTILGIALTNVNFLKKNMPALALIEDDNNYIAFADLQKSMDQEKLRRAFDSTMWAFQDLISGKLRNKELTKIEDLIKYINDNFKDVPNVLKNKFTEMAKLEFNSDENNDSKQGEFIMFNELVKSLNLDEGSEEKDVLEAVKNLTESNAALEKKVQDLGKDVKTKTGEVVKLTDEVNKIAKDKQVDLTEITNQITALTEKNTALENQLKLTEAGKVIDGFIFNATTGKGKIFPKQKQDWIKLYLTDPDGIKKVLDDMPDVINFKESGSSANAQAQDDDPTKELNRKSIELVEKEKIQFADAMNKVLESDKDLKQRYNEFTKK